MNSKFFTTRAADGKQVLNRTYWNAWYEAERGRLKDKGQSAWGKPTALMLCEISRIVGDLKGQNVAIFGEGDGRYSIHFARQGANVVHVDYSEGAINGLREVIRENGGHGIGRTKAEDQKMLIVGKGIIDIVQEDVSAYTQHIRSGGSISTLTDFQKIKLVLSSGLAEYLPPQELAELVRFWQEITLVEGAHAIVYLAQGPGVSEIPGEHPHEPGFIESLYDKGKWRFTFQGDTTREDTHIIIRPEDTTIEPDRPAETHIHRIMRFVAEKLE